MRTFPVDVETSYEQIGLVKNGQSSTETQVREALGNMYHRRPIRCARVTRLGDAFIQQPNPSSVDRSSPSRHSANSPVSVKFGFFNPQVMHTVSVNWARKSRKITPCYKLSYFHRCLQRPSLPHRLVDCMVARKDRPESAFLSPQHPRRPESTKAKQHMNWIHDSTSNP